MSNQEWAGPKRGVDRAVLLAHGAGSDRNAPALVAVADELAAAGIPSLRFDYPYRVAGRNAPDRPAVLEQSTRDAAAELARRLRLPPERLVLGGRSMGGRYCSLVVGSETDPVPALGLVLLGYPLHPAGKPDRLRVEHFPRVRVPVLFVSGTRDALAGRADLEQAATTVRGKTRFHWLETADHGFRPLKASGRSSEDVAHEAAVAATAWIRGLRPR